MIKTRQNPDQPDRTQYFVVKTPEDAALSLSECPQKQDHAMAQNLGKEWINTEKLREEYGSDKVEELVESGHLEKRQHPDFPEQTQLGKNWISTQSLLEKYGFDMAEELLKSGRVEKRQNPSCPERTQYFVKEGREWEEHDEEANLDEAKVQNRRKPEHQTDKRRKQNLQNRRKPKKHEAEEVDAEAHKATEVQKHGKAKKANPVVNSDGEEKQFQKHGKAKDAKPTVGSEGEEDADLAEDSEGEEKKVRQHGKATDADLVEGEEKSAAIPVRVVATVVAIIGVALLV